MRLARYSYYFVMCSPNMIPMLRTIFKLVAPLITTIQILQVGAFLPLPAELWCFLTGLPHSVNTCAARCADGWGYGGDSLGGVPDSVLPGDLQD